MKKILILLFICFTAYAYTPQQLKECEFFTKRAWGIPQKTETPLPQNVRKTIQLALQFADKGYPMDEAVKKAKKQLLFSKKNSSLTELRPRVAEKKMEITFFSKSFYS